jgi:2-oxoglutarate ferredoxin oxidoreductase subunit delta
MAKIIIKRERCKGCLLCVAFCPKGLIKADTSLNDRGVKPVKCKDDSGCIGCAFCALICPDNCIEIQK